MFRFFLVAIIICLSLFSVGLASADTLSPSQASQHVGEMATVEGKVTQVHFDARSGVTFINMGGRYPNHAFTGVIFRNYAANFRGVQALQGQVIQISGRVKLYKGKPEIILRKSSQISIP